ncbi:hypothetical protein V6K52_06020 [Knoellia sp. S7-12]|uniref:hypothetical protein n=1 Tax=Knoellia sp. S7-12 TaxID=3126698 RepID=UPI003369A7DF
MSDPILELLATPPNPSMSVDEHAVHAGGRRRLRRRTLRRTAAGLVGVVGIAAIAFGALGTGVDNDALPANPSPSIRTSAELFDGRFAVGTSDMGGSTSITFSSLVNGRFKFFGATEPVPNAVWFFPKDAGSTPRDMGDGVIVGTAPANATAFLTHGVWGQDGSTMDSQPIPGTDYQAVAIDYEDFHDINGYVTTYWRDDTATVRDGAGVVIPSGRIPGSTDVAFVDRTQGQLGIFGSEGTSSLRPLSAAGPVVTGDQDDKGTWSVRATAVLPVGARDPSFTWKNGTVAAATVVALGQAGVVASATAEAPGSSAFPAVASVNWTDAAGTRHTDEVK